MRKQHIFQVGRVNILGVCACSVASVMSDSLQSYGLQPTRLLCPWNSPGRNTGVGCCALLQGLFSTQVLNPLSYPAGRFFTLESSGKPILGIENS